MKIFLSDHKVDLKVAKAAGALRIDPADPRPVSELVESARRMIKSGAALIDVGLKSESAEAAAVLEQELVLPVIQTLSDESRVHVGVCTSDPQIMRLACNRGASYIIDPKALTADHALETAADLRVPVILCGVSVAEDEDPVSRLQEFFYERIDACLNAGIKRQNLLLDPLYGNLVRVDTALKLLGRLKPFESFALPLCVSIPSALPYTAVASDGTRTGGIMELTLGLFCADRGACIIRSDEVSAIAMALAAWQIMAQTARPHQLSRGIVRRMIGMRNAFRARRSLRQDGSKQNH